MKGLIVADCCIDDISSYDTYIDKYDVLFHSSGHYVGRYSLYRHMTYIYLALKANLIAHKYERVIIWQQYIGIYFMIFSIFFISSTPCIAGPSLIPKFNFIKKLLYKFSLLYNHGSFFTFNKEEKKHYVTSIGCDESKFKIITFTKRPSSYLEEKFHERCNNNRSYVFTGGTSNRNYHEYAYVAEKIPLKEFIAACTDNDIKNIFIPKNLKIFNDCYGDNFIDTLLGSSIVVLPIMEDNVSSGQLVFYLASQAGKPLIIPNYNIFKDYVTNDEVFYYNPKDSQSLYKTINYVYMNYSEALSKGLKLRQLYFNNFSSPPLDNIIENT